MTSLGSILWLLVIGGLFFFVMKKSGGCCGGNNSGGHNSGLKAKMKKDPVCGMGVSEDTEYRQKYDGTSYHFCSAGCMKQFRRDLVDYRAVAASSEQNHDSDCCR